MINSNIQIIIVRTFLVVVMAVILATTLAFAETYYDSYREEHKRTSDELKALEIARQECGKRGWEWKDVSIQDLGDYYNISTSCFQDGGNAGIDIDKKTGKVLKKNINPM